MRFQGDGDEEFPGQWFLWEQALMRSVSGRKGQTALRDLRDALLSLPEKRLIAGRLADETGCVCTLGALALKRRVDGGESREDVLASLAEMIPEGLYDEYEADMQTVHVGERAGVTRTMIADLAYRNDELFRETPEHRYERILRYVESLIL